MKATLGLQSYPSWATVPDVIPQGPGMLSRVANAARGIGRFLFADETSKTPRGEYGDYIDLATAAYRAKALAVVALVAGILERGMYGARVTGDAGILTSNVLATTAVRLLLNGAVCWVKVSSGNTAPEAKRRPLLLPASGFTILHGDVRPSSWKYQVTIPAPNGGKTVLRRRRDVMHVHFVGDKATPWIGQSPLDRASVTSALAYGLEQSLLEEANVPVKRTYVMPTGFPDDKIEGLKTQLKGQGSFALLETTRQGGGLGAATAPAKDWDVARLGPEPTPSEVLITDSSQARLMAALGAHPSMQFANATAGVLREARRQVQIDLLESYARVIEDAFNDSFRGLTAKITFPVRSDVMLVIARTVNSLVQSGYTPEAAHRIAGLPADLLNLTPEAQTKTTRYRDDPDGDGKK